MLALSQGNGRASLKFHILTCGSGWNKSALKSAFHHGLNAESLTKITFRDENMSLDSLIDLAIHLDNLLRYRCFQCPKNPLLEPTP